MSLHRASLPVHLSLGAVVALSLGACGHTDSEADPAPTPAAAVSSPTSTPTPAPRLIAYAGGESPGVSVTSSTNAGRLTGSPASFRRFVGRTADRLGETTACDAAVGVTVETLRTDGYAIGGVNDCGGYEALWAVVDGSWKQIDGTQDSFSCQVLERYHVPSDVAGDTCYDHRAEKSHRYHQS